MNDLPEVIYALHDRHVFRGVQAAADKIEKDFGIDGVEALAQMLDTTPPDDIFDLEPRRSQAAAEYPREESLGILGVMQRLGALEESVREDVYQYFIETCTEPVEPLPWWRRALQILKWKKK